MNGKAHRYYQIERQRALVTVAQMASHILVALRHVAHLNQLHELGLDVPLEREWTDLVAEVARLHKATQPGAIRESETP